MKISIIIYSNDSETVWNAFRLANTALGAGDQIDIFLLGKGVEAAMSSSLQYDVLEQIRNFQNRGGSMFGCGICCESRMQAMPFLLEGMEKCEVGSMKQLYDLVVKADKVLTF